MRLASGGDRRGDRAGDRRATRRYGPVAPDGAPCSGSDRPRRTTKSTIAIRPFH